MITGLILFVNIHLLRILYCVLLNRRLLKPKSSFFCHNASKVQISVLMKVLGFLVKQGTDRGGQYSRNQACY